MATTVMKRPQSISLIYDSSNAMAKKTLEYFLSLGFFELAEPVKSRIDLGLDEYRCGKYVIVNKGKSKHFDESGNK
jgi:hypothetical protein